LGPLSQGLRPISVNLSEWVAVPLSGRLRENTGDGFPLAQDDSETSR
jgi:hypothetical protein